MKVVLSLSAGAAAALSIALWQQESANEQLARELAALQAQVHPPPAAAAATTGSPAPATTVVDPASLRQIEDDILAAAELAVPLNPEQQERVRLDTLIRKGELDLEYATLFRQLHLPHAKIDKLKTLIVERNQAIHDAGQIANEEGLSFATLAERDRVNRAATAEVDSRIEAALGADVRAAVQEYEELAYFRGLAGAARTVRDRYDPIDDEAVLNLARALKRAAPDYPELVYQANGWPFDIPAEVRETIRQTHGDAAADALQPRTAFQPTRLKLAALARDAVLDGRIPVSRLSGSVSREYRIALEARKEGLAP